MANSLMEQALDRDKRPLEPLDPGRQGDVSIVQWPDVLSEVDGIVSAIADDVNRREIEPGDILVLTNWRSLGEQIRDRLVELGVPVRSFFTEEILTSDASREAVALLRLVVDQADQPAMRVVVGLGDQSGRSPAYQRLLDHCYKCDWKPIEAFGRLAAGETLDGLRVQALLERYELAMRRVERFRELALSDLVDELFPLDDDALAGLRGVAIESLETAEEPSDLLDDIIAAVTQDDVPQQPNFVRVMSLHKSKGLTSDSVYVVGAVDGILPTVTSSAPSEVQAAVEEGRRLFYVAITRTAKELVISTSRTMDRAHAYARRVKFEPSTTRRVGDRYTIRTIASPYIAELGPLSPRGVRGEVWLDSRSGGI